MKKLDVSALPPAQQVWAVIAWASSHVGIIHEKSLDPKKQVALLTRAGANTLDAGDGQVFDVDSVLAGTEQFLRMTLSMLAYENGWWINKATRDSARFSSNPCRSEDCRVAYRPSQHLGPGR